MMHSAMMMGGGEWAPPGNMFIKAELIVGNDDYTGNFYGFAYNMPGEIGTFGSLTPRERYTELYVTYWGAISSTRGFYCLKTFWINGGRSMELADYFIANLGKPITVWIDAEGTPDR